jgi:hypothetical protein
MRADTLNPFPSLRLEPSKGFFACAFFQEQLADIEYKARERHRRAHHGYEQRANDTGSEYSGYHRLLYVHGQETDEEENDTYAEDEVKTWSLNHVAEYLVDVGVERKHCDMFRDQDFNGEALIGVDGNFISPISAPWVCDYGPG